VVQQARHGKLSINYKSETLNRIEEKIELQSSKTTSAIISSGLLVCGAVLYSGGLLLEAQVLAGLGAAGALWALFKK